MKPNARGEGWFLAGVLVVVGAAALLFALASVTP